MDQRARWVAVIGGGEGEPDDLLAQAEAVGRGVAERGWVLVTGGLGGVMAAASRGAAGAGGVVVGLLPGADRAAANPWVGVAVPTGLGEGRNVLVVRAADAVVAVGGGWGTLSELALALRAGHPVVGLDTWAPTRRGAERGDVARVGDAAGALAALDAALGG